MAAAPVRVPTTRGHGRVWRSSSLSISHCYPSSSSSSSLFSGRRSRSKPCPVCCGKLSGRDADAGAEWLDLSALAKRLKPSPTVFMSDLAMEMKREGRDIVSLSVGEPDFATPERIAQAGVLAISQGKTKYSPNAGVAPLRQAVARKLQRENGILDMGESNVVVTNGAKQAVAQAVLATCSPGDEVLVPSPYWVSYPDIARLAGATPVVVETKLEENFLLTPHALEAALTERSRVLILCSPSNPTGSVYSRRQLAELAHVVAKHPKLLVVSDEIYEHIFYSEDRDHRGRQDQDQEQDAYPCSFASCGVEGVAERTVTVNGFSKAFAMTGWRVGYLAAAEPIAKAAAKVQSQFTSGASSLAQYAALEALLICEEEEEEEEEGGRGGKEVQKMVAEFRKRRDYACQRLEQIGGANLPYEGGDGYNNENSCKPAGAFYLFPDVSSWIEDTGSESSNELCMRILEEAGVALVPGSAFGKETCLRMSYATSMENLEKAFDKIETWLDKNRNQNRSQS